MERTLKSWLALPRWVNIWVWLFLVPVNIAPLFFLDTQTGTYGALATVFITITNGYLMLANRGVSKVMAIPHLIAWVPLVGFIAVGYLNGAYVWGSPEAWLALALFVMNGISLGFDVYDTLEWWRGNRQVTGFPNEPARY